MQLRLNDQDKAALLKLAKDTLLAAFTDETDAVLKKFETELPKYSPALKEEHSCFVTLLTETDELRGCIGGLTADRALYENVWEKTQHAAFGDPRFVKVRPEEAKNLKVEISVLSPLMPLPSLDKIEIGRHGLMVQSGNQRGVLLAKVAAEYNWTREEFLNQTCIKAGLAPELVSKYRLYYFEEVSF